MTVKMAYLIGMVLGNGSIQDLGKNTRITIDIPFKNLYTNSKVSVAVYVKASVLDIKSFIEPMLGTTLATSESKHSVDLSFTMDSSNYIIQEIKKMVCNGTHHTTMRMHPDLFSMSMDEKKALLKGIADVTGYIRSSNMAYGQVGAHRVYIEVPKNWDLVIDIANMLQAVDVPVQTIDFGHPNFRDSQGSKYRTGFPRYWAKEHQIKIFANEFLKIGFNIKHKEDALQTFAADLMANYSGKDRTHQYYWEKKKRAIPAKPSHPAENDPLLPASIRGKHYDSWIELAKDLGYEKKSF